MYYLNYFFIFSIIGHLFEVIACMIFNQTPKSGFLYGYWTPVYGIGIVIILLLHRFIFKMDINKFLKWILFIISVSLILTFTEFLGGHLLYFVFHKDFWDYSNMRYNMGKYICLEVSLVWTIGSIIFVIFIKPWMDKIAKKIPNIITYILVMLMIIDFICTMIFKSKLV